MNEKLYHLTDGSAKPLSRHFFDTEDELQALVARNPTVLLGELYSQEDIAAGRELLLIGREVGLCKDGDTDNSLWLDILFADNEGLPVLVEVKRSVNPEVRRTVIAQLIDYCSLARSWSKESLRSAFLQSNPSQDVRTKYDNDDFWNRVLDHLREEAFTAVIVADRIEKELSAMLSFLDRNMPNITVCGVEVNTYGDVVSTHFVENRERHLEKQCKASVHWTRETLMSKCRENRSDLESIVSRLIDYAERSGLPCAYGTGRVYPTFLVSIDDAWLYQIEIRTRDASLYISYKSLSNRLGEPYSKEYILDAFSNFPSGRRELRHKEMFITVSVSDLREEQDLAHFMQVCDSLIAAYRSKG